MAGLPRAPTKRMYSWWWDSHISPKNSKWLQENLTDMDAKVKAMIKLIEEDADSFARRAEMYYKKRPELMKLVEDFYRAYRALAERYDNVTGVLRQAQHTMAEAFPNHASLEMSDDLPENTTSEVGPQTPELPPPLRPLFGPDHLQKGRKQLGEARIRKGLDFCEDSSESEVVSKFEKEIQALKDALAQLEAEKEAGLIQYEQSLEKLSKFESEVSRMQEASRELNDRANRAEGEAQVLRVSLAKLEAEKESSLLEYQKCLQRMVSLENVVSQAKGQVGELNERAPEAESEKEEALNRYKQSLEMISNLENKLKLAEEDARQLSERADNAEREVGTLKQVLAKLTEENESAVLQYRQCLEKISMLENELSFAEKEVQRLEGEIDSRVTKLKGAEELCLTLEKSNQALNSELGSLVLKMGSQSEELTDKQKELGKLWTCLQEERFRFVEAETAFQTLQHLHSQTQEQLRSLALELENKGQLLRDTETRNESLLNEILRINEENMTLNECNLSSSMTIKEMKNDISGLLESRKELTEEVELRVDERNALQQEIYCLKEDVNELDEKNRKMLEQVQAVGMIPETFESSVKQLQTENLDLKETSEKERAEKLLLLKKLAIMEQLLEKNALLEKSISNLTAELEGARSKISALEQSFEALLEEKSTILAEKAAVMSQLQASIENLEKISEKNNCLENSLSDACEELEGLKERSKNLEDSCQLLEKEKSCLINEKDTLVLQGKTTQQTLEALVKRQRELEERYSCLEKELKSTFSKMEELHVSLDIEKKEHATFAQRTETQLAGMGKQICLLQEEVFSRRREFEEELDKALNYQLEIFILRRCVVDLKEKNSSLLAECQKLVEASHLSEKLISELKQENLGKQVEVKSLSDKTSMFKIGMCELSKALGVDLGHRFEDKFVGDQKYLSLMLSKLEDTKNSLFQVLDENHRLDVEMSVIVTLLGQLRLEAKTFDMERVTLDKELKIKNEQLILSQNEAKKLLQLNGDISLKVSELTSLVASMKREIDEVNVVSNNRQNQIHKLSDDNFILTEGNNCLHKENMELEVKLKKLREELGLTTQLWEGEVATMFGELQYSIVNRALLEEKFYELKYGVTSKDAQIEQLEKSIGSLEGENSGLKAQLAAYAPLVMSLKDSIYSLESHTLRAEFQKNHAEGAKEVVVSSEKANADPKVLDLYSELKDLQYKVKMIEKAVVQKEMLEAQENFVAYARPESATKSVDTLKLRGCANGKYSVQMFDNSEAENEISMKDIMLDSESSSHELSRQVERNSGGKRVESWDSADLDRNIELIVGRDKRAISPPGEMSRRQSKHRSSGTATEKELGVDKLEISRTLSQRSQEPNKAKILERLNSDSQKLTNLQITVQDLMKKVEITEKGKKGKAFNESDTLREQLEEAEEAIIALSNFNCKLTRSFEKGSCSSEIKLEEDSEVSGSARRKRITEQARKMSEKIGRLQLEVQKIQLVFLKIQDENEKERKGKFRITEMRRRVLLRDYLYGNTRTPSHLLGRKRSSFCGCVQPSTQGD